jgi:predicted alpha/beta-fold hydrolase
MPYVESTYCPPAGFSNGHLLTILPQFRRVRNVRFRRERIETPDGDFLDLDWAQNGSARLAVLSHGLEGSAQRPYVKGMTRALQQRGWDVLAWNYRGCSGEPNRKLRWYHSGDTGDLHCVIQHAARKYSCLVLIGFSLGGNITLKYLGERAEDAAALVSKSVTLSVPCDLKSSAVRLATRANTLYMKRFLRSIGPKIREKAERMPGEIDAAGFHKIRTFLELDDRYTAPIHGFRNAEDYFEKSSARQFLPRIRIPTLLINARNDPFLAEPSFPYEEAALSEFFHFEAPASGGHVGFVTFGNNGEYWSETRTLEFLEL